MGNPRQSNKSDLRTQARERRRLAAPALESAGPRLRDALLVLPEVASAGCLAAYVARPTEPDTTDLLVALAGSGRRVLLPVVRPDLDLDWALDTGPEVARVRSAVRPGLAEPAGPRLGVEAITQADVVVVPALLVDRHGGRLGYGGGSYDRALARVRPEALVVALLLDGELTDDLVPAEPHDIRVHVVVTPSGGAVRLRDAG